MNAAGRWVSLGGAALLLPGRAPEPGMSLAGDFVLPPARNARAPLTATRLCCGRVVVSTLPNIGRHACVAQVLDLEEHLAATYAGVTLVHVSADAASYWREVDLYHAALAAEAYTLDGADDDSVAAFTSAFGVAASGHRRIAHGLFGLVDGRFTAVDIPAEQMGTPDVHAFVARFTRT